MIHNSYIRIGSNKAVPPRQKLAEFCQLKLHFSVKSAKATPYRRGIVVDLKTGGVLKIANRWNPIRHLKRLAERTF